MKITNFLSIAIFGIALLPLYAQPLRFEAYETQRAGLLLVLLTAALPGLSQTRCGKPLRTPLTRMALIWCAALALSTVFALSPQRALMGDVTRRMGLVTQVAIAAALWIGAWGSLRALWRWFWLAGAVIAVHTLLQAGGWIAILSDIPRPEGLLGAAPFTGGWLSLALLWTGVGLLAEAPTERRGWYMGGMGLMLLALAVSGARGAALGLFAGALTIGLIWAGVQGRRWIALALLLSPLLVIAGVLGLARIEWQNTPLAGLSLLSRLYLDSSDVDFTRLQREAYWQITGRLVQDWPLLTNVWGGADRWSGLRPLFGYGLDSFEAPYRLLIPADSAASLAGRPTDRAHNDEYDTLLMTGWAGIIARLGLWLVICWVALRRLGVWRWHILPFIFGGALTGWLMGRGSPWQPILMTAGAVGGVWLWLGWRAWHQPRGALNPHALLALGVLVAYVIDLQFSFTTAATGWPAWLAFGLLCAPTGETSEHFEFSAAPLWAGLAGAILLRGLALGGASLIAQVVLLAAMLSAARIIAPVKRRDGLIIAVLWALGLAGTLIQTPLAALWDAGFVVMALRLLGGLRWHRKWWALVFAGGLLWWAAATAADIYLRQGLRSATPLADFQNAAALRPWDDRLAAAAGDAALQEAQRTGSEAMIEQARGYLLQAAALNSYDYGTAWRLALLEALRAQVALNERQVHINAADRYFAAAARLWPAEADIWAGWARFSLLLKGDPQAARQQAQTALSIEPDNAVALDVLEVSDGQ